MEVFENEEGDIENILDEEAEKIREKEKKEKQELIAQLQDYKIKVTFLVKLFFKIDSDQSLLIVVVFEKLQFKCTFTKQASLCHVKNHKNLSKLQKKIIDKKSKLQILKFRYLEKFLNDLKYNASFKISELRAFILDTFFTPELKNRNSAFSLTKNS